MVNKFIQKALKNKKQGALHRELGIPQGHKIPKGKLKELSHAKIGTHVRGHKVTTLLKRRAVFAENLSKLHHKKKSYSY
jgi:hypothetical protein